MPSAERVSPSFRVCKFFSVGRSRPDNARPVGLVPNTFLNRRAQFSNRSVKSLEFLSSEEHSPHRNHRRRRSGEGGYRDRDR